ncbi:hypothetical protein [Paraburkholderia sp. J8-2]|uniref:hypothetical protein n=1 Tax=Paraburkholderia sp. J8-2 TaxID=2805440 RepID=UPI002AB78B9E|nr:hypothetical protein [Paraburkholderia sp. J8-2]
MTDQQDDQNNAAHAPTLWDAFEMGFQLRSAMLGHVLDGRDVGRLTTCEFWHPSMCEMHKDTDLHVGLSVGEAIVKLKAEVRRRLSAFDAASPSAKADETTRVAQARRDAFNEAASVDAKVIAMLLATGKVTREDVDMALARVAEMPEEAPVYSS